MSILPAARRRFSAGAAGLLLGASAALALAPAAQAAGTLSAAAERASASTAGAAYSALTPTRLLDTRVTGSSLGPQGTTALTVIGGSVPANATAVALNVTVTDTTAAGYLSVYPAGLSRPVISNLNWIQGETVANLVIVPVGGGGQVGFYNSAGSTDLVVDLEGYFAPAMAGSTVGSYLALSPARITDTRAGSGYPNAGATMGPGSTLAVQATGVGGVPPSGVAAVLVNLTVTNTTAAGYLTVYPAGVSRPSASNLNWSAGATVANRVLVPVGASGQISLYNQSGSADVVVDVDGFFSAGTLTGGTPSLFTAIDPVRVLDTRQTGTALGAGQAVLVQIAGLGGIPTNAIAVAANVTVANTTAASYLTVYPGGIRPVASDVNWTAGQVVPNLTVATLSGSGAVTIYNNAGTTDVIVDAFGYFTPITTATTATAPTTTVASSNWSGYELGDGPYTSVAGTFTVPNLAASSTTTATAEWAGIDGAANSSLIQAGVAEIYHHSTNQVSIFAWWEILPAPATPITTMVVAPGDTVTVNIAQVSGTTWSISVRDNTTGVGFSTSQVYSGPLSSAEWIVEAPTMSSTGTVATLGDYSPNVTFTNLGASGTSLSTTEVVMVQGGAIVSTPSALTSAGFAVAYGSVAPAAP
ncbi:MAG: G1 family glutamic endopeptidase [Candidatus Dormibacteria bacterium]